MTDTTNQNTHTVRVRFIDGPNATLYQYLTHLYLEPGDKLVVNSPISGYTVVEAVDIYYNTRSSGATKWVLGRADLSPMEDVQRIAKEAAERVKAEREQKAASARQKSVLRKKIHDLDIDRGTRREQIKTAYVESLLMSDSEYQSLDAQIKALQGELDSLIEGS